MREALSPSRDRWSPGFWWQGVVGVWMFGQVGCRRDDSWSSVSSLSVQRRYLQNEIRHDFFDKARARLMCYTFLVVSNCACVWAFFCVRVSTLIPTSPPRTFQYVEAEQNAGEKKNHFGHYLTNTAPCWLVRTSSETCKNLFRMQEMLVRCQEITLNYYCHSFFKNLYFQVFSHTTVQLISK